MGQAFGVVPFLRGAPPWHLYRLFSFFLFAIYPANRLVLSAICF